MNFMLRRNMPIDAIKKELFGTIVMTKYNKKTYRVDDIDLTQNANSKLVTLRQFASSYVTNSFLGTFEHRGSQISYAQYFKDKYNITIKNVKQPILISMPKERDRRGEREMVCLLPEICYMTGLNDAMRANWKLMEAISGETRPDPNKRVQKLMKYAQR